MKVVVSANGVGLDAPASPVFGRCHTFVFVETESMEAESVENPAINAAGGAGIQAAQFVVERGAEAAISGNVGPNAFNVFEAAGVSVYLGEEGTVGQVMQGFKEGRLEAVGSANVQAHSGTKKGSGSGRGRGRGRGGASSQASSAGPTLSREEEIASLKEMAAGLRKQMANVMERLDRLEEEE